MRFVLLSLTVLATVASYVSAADHEDVKVEVTNPVECSRKTQRGDKIEVHYRGTLAQDGSQFDASYDRGEPLSFTVGNGQVIKGWDEGLLGMCVGEKRLLTIKPDFGYGNQAMGPIPAGSTLIFETELMGIAGVKKDEL
ncbi:MAG: Peptidyl-prolyl cis-trans isomerase fpr2 [Pleopsidium flavum]|nr:MAG: Peptidyl-prolyl cis-trans isomerase fpr2 [Pleopsidium flavum]